MFRGVLDPDQLSSRIRIRYRTVTDPEHCSFQFFIKLLAIQYLQINPISTFMYLGDSMILGQGSKFSTQFASPSPSCNLHEEEVGLA
jgi:hypothetical protein